VENKYTRVIHVNVADMSKKFTLKFIMVPVS